MRDVANETLPVPVGPKTLDTYGKVIKGKMNDDMVKIAFIMKFFLRDCCLFILKSLSWKAFLFLF